MHDRRDQRVHGLQPIESVEHLHEVRAREESAAVREKGHQHRPLPVFGEIECLAMLVEQLKRRCVWSCELIGSEAGHGVLLLRGHL